MKYLFPLIFLTACETGISPMSPHFISCEQMKELRSQGLLPVNPNAQEDLRRRFYDIASMQLYGVESEFDSNAELFPCNY